MPPEKTSERQITYKTGVIQSDGIEVRVSVEFRDRHNRGLPERTGNWYSCVTSLDGGHILGGTTSGSGNTLTDPIVICKQILDERLKRGKHQ